MWSGKETGKEEGKSKYEREFYTSDSQIVLSGPPAAAEMGSSCRCKFSGLGPGLLNQKALSWGPAGLVHSSLLITTVGIALW